jgi:hypothetical protein
MADIIKQAQAHVGALHERAVDCSKQLHGIRVPQ